MADAQTALLTSLLRDVSRSFYLTLRVLPGRIRPQIGLAYLLARTTDTIADTALLPVEKRLGALELLRANILGAQSTAPDFGEFLARQGSAAERVLLEKCALSLKLLESFDEHDRALIRQVLDIITSGQELDLRRFADASPSRVVALTAEAELDDYTYRVAGCVGEFWTRICRRHLFPKAVLDNALLLAKGVRFGKGLQLVNILRDLPVDLRNGRCYLPEPSLAERGLRPEELLNSVNEPRLRPLFNRYLARAEADLFAGWDYTNSLPRRFIRVRLACAWPILIGIETVSLLRAGKVLDPRQRIKVTRRKVRELLLRSILWYPWPRAWTNLVQPRQPGLTNL